MRKNGWLALALGVVLSTGCYHQVVHTGLAPGNVVVEHWFVSTWIWGLVPAKPIDVHRECPAGVSRIMSETSRVNVFVTILTIGIYAPKHVRVDCALYKASALPGAPEHLAGWRVE
jgi:hypothetical protein